MRVCLIPKAGRGGPASFQTRLAAELNCRGVETTFDPNSRPLAAVLVFAGTKNLFSLWRCRRQGIRIVQRLDGINWLQRAHSRGPVYGLRAESLNLQLRLIRSQLADRIIYQSGFVREWWERWFGTAVVPARVIHNGVPLEEYPPRKEMHDGTLLVVEGTLQYNDPARKILSAANRALIQEGPLRRLTILAEIGSAWESEWARYTPRPEVAGLRPRAEAKARQQNAALLLSMEINPPCPNAIIEALAAGLPVLAFDTGSARELIGAGGETVRYDGNPWRLEVPRNLDALGETGRQILGGWREYSRKARSEAERRFDIRSIAQSYLEMMVG
ncbi:MAG: glycosyltransferase family 4 protein [Anaerolineales bacterium]